MLARPTLSHRPADAIARLCTRNRLKLVGGTVGVLCAVQWLRGVAGAIVEGVYGETTNGAVTTEGIARAARGQEVLSLDASRAASADGVAGRSAGRHLEVRA